MQIRKATTQDLECVRELTRETICQIYPKYYPAGAVQFFLNHHCDGKISADIRQGCVYLAEDPADGIVGTVTVKADEISRLFVLPEQQRGTSGICRTAGLCGIPAGDAGRITAGKGNVSETGVSRTGISQPACGGIDVFML